MTTQNISSEQQSAKEYLLAAEEMATTLPPALTMPARPIQRLAVIGSGTMGSGIAIASLDAGFSVTVLDQDITALSRASARIFSHYTGRVEAGKLIEEDATQRRSRLSVSSDWESIRNADIVVEAVYEDLSVKRDVFSRIDKFARLGAVLATNTSYLDVDEIALATSRPHDVLGLHFFSPANVMKLLEVVRGKESSAEVLATGMAFGRSLKKIPVLTGNAFGFIGNRIYNAYRRQCEFMLEDGAWPEEIDGVLKTFGFAMGPFAVADLSGLDIAWRMRSAAASTRDPRERYVPILDRLCEAGRLGRKSSEGYYTYPNGQLSSGTDETVRKVILNASAERGIERRILSAEEILRRALSSMVNEAALLLADGVATRITDVDVVLARGYGFPQTEGGPVHWARRRGRDQLELDIDEIRSACGWGFKAGNLDLIFTTDD